ncbi:MAG: hypothetical protein ABSB91_02340 [Sedimentisphaerales bacterium]
MSSGTGLDVRLPIGIMFTLFGAIIAIYGMVSDPAIYQRSLDININLWWGLVMVVFGGVLLIMARRSAQAKKKTENR